MYVCIYEWQPPGHAPRPPPAYMVWFGAAARRPPSLFPAPQMVWSLISSSKKDALPLITWVPTLSPRPLHLEGLF